MGEHRFERGDGVVVLTASAGRDERVFADADRFDITRYAGSRPARRHLRFSLGLHYCVGAPLARMEAQAAIGALIARSSELRAVADRVEYQPSLIHRGLLALPIQVRV